MNRVRDVIRRKSPPWLLDLVRPIARTIAPDPAPPDRRSRLLHALDLTAGHGLEIGALNKPMLQRPHNTVTYADHATTESLRAIYAGHENVLPTDLVPVDIVWEGGQLQPLLNGQTFDYIVASHVIEHVPNIVWWLQQLAAALVPFGTLRLAIPDKRYSFDFLRRETTIADALGAWVSNRKRPDPRDILDFWGNYRAVDAGAAWQGNYPSDTAFHLHEMQAALQRCRETETYHDVHCTVCTPQSFVALMQGLAELRILDFACTAIHPTARGELEFFAHLMKVRDPDAITQSWDWAAWAVAEAA